MKIELWTEGFQITGNSSKACKLAEIEANSLDEACELYNKDRNVGLLDKRDGYWVEWGCQVFDNEIDARKSFG